MIESGSLRPRPSSASSSSWLGSISVPGWWPYLGPYGLFLCLVQAESWSGGRLAQLLAVLKVALPGALLVGFAVRGRYPELRGFRWRSACLLDVAVGLGIAVLWVAPYLLFPSLPRGPAFDPEALGGATLGLRLLGFAAVTPFVEELFVRSFLLRYAEVVASGGDFRSLPMARYAVRGFIVTLVWFTFSHAPWEWWVAAPTGLIFNLWLYRRGHLGATVLAHAVANASIWAFVVFGPGGAWAFL